MTVDLAVLSEDIYRTLIALPYRVGYYISESDKTGGSDSQAQELHALENLFTFYVEDTLKSEFSQSVMLATLQHKAYWPEWRLNIDTVLDECTQMVEFLDGNLAPKPLLAFKNNLLEIAVTVALAYNETTPKFSLIEKIKSYFGDAKTPSQNQAYFNISDDEKRALNDLAKTLGIEYKVS